MRQGADVNKRSNHWTILLWVCWKNQNESLPLLIRLLVKYGANIHDKETNGSQALQLLARFNQTSNLIESIEALIGAKAEVNHTDNRRWSVLHHLARFNQSKQLFSIIELLLQNGLNIQATDWEGWNVLHYLARFYQGTDLIDFFHLLIRHKINLHARDLEGWNVLHVLCRWYTQSGKLLPIFKLLIENGVDLHCRTYKNLHALELLLFNPGGDFHATCMWAIQNRRSDWNKLDWNEESILNMAKLGCQKWTNYFCAISIYRCTDDKGKSAFDYLTEVCLNSTSLCPRCRPRLKYNKLSESETYKRKPIRWIKFPAFQPSKKEKLVLDRSCSIISTEHDLKPVPKPIAWQWMANAWQMNELSLDDAEFYMGEHSHWHSNPKEDCINGCRWCTIFGHLRGYLNSLIDQIRILDDRFESGPLMEYGSWAERTDILAANEFDFGVPLIHFKAITRESTDISNAVLFKKKGAEAFVFYDQQGVSSGRLLYYYKLLVEEASSRVFNVHFFHPIVTMSETCVTLTFIYRGRREKPLKISADLSLVVTVEGLSPFQDNSAPRLQDVLYRLNPRAQESKTLHLVPHRRNKKGAWKVSPFALERGVFLHPYCFPDVSAVLRLIKFFVLIANQRWNPLLEDEEHTIQRKTKPSSYALKTCLFIYMEYWNPPWGSNDRLDHCIGVFKVYLDQSVRMKSYFAKNITACEVSHDSKIIVGEILNKLELMKSRKGYSYSFEYNSYF